MSEFERRVIREEVHGVQPESLRRELEERAIAQLEAGVPLQYVIGRWEFCDLSLALERGILIPRPETEGLALEVIARVPQGTTGLAIDMGTGTGALALALAAARPTLSVRAWDLDPRAVRLARRNARLTGIPVRVEEADLRTAPLPERGVAVIVSNPPYIASAEIPRLDASVREFESHLALDGGADGLDLVRVVLARAAAALVPGGLVALEIGWDQGAAGRALAEAAGLREVAVLPDLAGKDRYLLGRAP